MRLPPRKHDESNLERNLFDSAGRNVRVFAW